MWTNRPGKVLSIKKENSISYCLFSLRLFGQGSELIPEGGTDCQNWNKLSQEVNTLKRPWFSLLTLAHVEVRG